MTNIILTKDDLKKISEIVADKTIFCTKKVLTSDEVAKYMGISRSYLYKLTMRKEIPHYKPMGKVVYFERQEIEEWLLQNRVSTESEINHEALNYCKQKPIGDERNKSRKQDEDWRSGGCNPERKRFVNP